MLIFSFPAPILFALLLNEIKNTKFKKLVQTSSYLPHFISIVVVVGIIMQVLSPNGGVVNLARQNLGLAKVSYIMEPGWFRPIYIISGVWQSMGWNAIIFMAALAGIDVELYEAAMIDGAGRLRQTWNITLPGIAPAIVISFILSIGNILNVGYEKVILLMNDLTKETGDVISSYVYRVGLLDNNYSFSTAVGLFESVLGLILVAGANWLSNTLTDTALW
jgi:putative aldouronate transport system permease protein